MNEYSYTVVLEPVDEGGYTVTVPALPAVVTEGDSVEEAIEMAKDAIECYLSSLAKEGRPVPVEEGPAGRMTVRLQVTAPASS
ncbi:MAG: type II toxin-antitoxin system HicB family antitoxin [Candidatus Hydrogenedentota bacterium]